MTIKRYDRQSFLGDRSQSIFSSTRLGVVGLSGGGSHIIQQCAHIGFQSYANFDPQALDETNLNRLVGCTAQDVENETLKVDIAERVIRGLQPDAVISSYPSRWQENPEVLKTRDLLFSAVDSYQERHELEVLARRYMIPMVDVGMDVRENSNGTYSMFGQIILSLPGYPCMRCMGFLTDAKLQEEARRYGDAGSVPQVVWANGILASFAVGVGIELLTNWTQSELPPLFLTYDGRRGIVQSRPILELVGPTCQHYPPDRVGDPVFKSI